MAAASRKPHAASGARAPHLCFMISRRRMKRFTTSCIASLGSSTGPVKRARSRGDAWIARSTSVVDLNTCSLWMSERFAWIMERCVSAAGRRGYGLAGRQWMHPQLSRPPIAERRRHGGAPSKSRNSSGKPAFSKSPRSKTASVTRERILHDTAGWRLQRSTGWSASHANEYRMTHTAVSTYSACRLGSRRARRGAA